MFRRLEIVASFLLLAATARAEEPSPTRMPLELPLLQAPESFEVRLHFPTWTQAFDIAEDEVLLTHWAIHEGTSSWPRWVGIPVEMIATTALDYYELSYIGGAGWAHEEGHRGVMRSLGVPSINGMDAYLNPFVPAGAYAVYGMTDAQLAAIKQNKNADWTHVQEAGLETQGALLVALDSDTFFYDRPAYQNIPYQLYARFRIATYYQICTQVTPELVAAIGNPPDERLRDFTGADCTGWAYDMARPSEPYSARGPDLSGIGIRRYRLTADLDARGYFAIIHQRNLVLASLIDPQIFGFGSFPGKNPFNGEPFRWNASISPQVTPFGSALDLNVFAKQGGWKAHAILRAYHNASLTLPGLELNLVRIPAAIGSVPVMWSATAGVWLQPAHQEFLDTGIAFGGRAGGGVNVPIIPFVEAFARVDAKTAGWVPVTTTLGPPFSANIGVALAL